MTFEKFLNALRIMRSIDLHEIEAAGIDLESFIWPSFREDPYRWFIRASDKDAAAVWSIIERRNK